MSLLVDKNKNNFNYLPVPLQVHILTYAQECPEPLTTTLYRYMSGREFTYYQQGHNRLMHIVQNLPANALNINQKIRAIFTGMWTALSQFPDSDQFLSRHGITHRRGIVGPLSFEAILRFIRRKQPELDQSLLRMAHQIDQVPAPFLADPVFLARSERAQARLTETWFRTTDFANQTTLAFSFLKLNFLSLQICEIARTRFNALTEMDLSSNHLTELPIQFFELRTLQTLNLGDNGLTNLPPECGQLTALRSLSLFQNNLLSLPEELYSLTALNTLDIQHNKLVEFSHQIGNLTSLRRLIACNNSLTCLPSEIGQLDSLLALNVNHNSLRYLPIQVGRMTHLLMLHVADNRLTRLPSTIGTMSELSFLDVSGNQLTSIPEEINDLRRLSTLSLNRNPDLTNLPTFHSRDMTVNVDRPTIRRIRHLTTAMHRNQLIEISLITLTIALRFFAGK